MSATASSTALRPLLKHLCAAAPGLFREPAGLLVWGGDVGIGVDNDPATCGILKAASAH